MEYGTTEFVALVRDAFERELARGGDSLSATAAAVSAAILAMPGRSPEPLVRAVQEALGPQWDAQFVVGSH